MLRNQFLIEEDDAANWVTPPLILGPLLIVCSPLMPIAPQCKSGNRLKESL